MREDCRIDAVRDDGTLELTWLSSGEKTRASLQGIVPAQPLPPLYREILVDRVEPAEQTLRAERRGADGDSVVVNLHVYGWHDKSGEVWIDIAPGLLERGLATVAPGDFPERAEYERAAARAEG